jgi:hypothetical protein
MPCLRHAAPPVTIVDASSYSDKQSLWCGPQVVFSWPAGRLYVTWVHHHNSVPFLHVFTLRGYFVHSSASQWPLDHSSIHGYVHQPWSRKSVEFEFNRSPAGRGHLPPMGICSHGNLNVSTGGSMAPANRVRQMFGKQQSHTGHGETEQAREWNCR